MANTEMVADEKQSPEELLELLESTWSKVTLDENDEVIDTDSNRSLIKELLALHDDIEYQNFESDEDSSRFFDLEYEIEEAAENLGLIRGTSSQDKEEDIPELNEKQIEAGKLLQQVYESWSNVSSDNQGEYRNPANEKEVKESRSLIRKAFVLGGDHPFIEKRINEVEAVLDKYEEYFGMDYYVSIWGTLLFILLLGIPFYFLDFSQDFPSIEYNQEWFTTTKKTWITLESFVKPEERAGYKEKVRLPKGSKLEPLGQKGTDFIKAKTESGQIGFVYIKDLEGFKYVSIKPETELFTKPNASETTLSQEESTGEIIRFQTVTKPGRLSDKLTYANVRFDDGTTAWVKDYDLRHLINEGIPSLNQTLSIIVTQEVIENKILGKTLEEVEKIYFPAQAVLDFGKETIANFPQIDPFLEGKQYKNLRLFIDKNKVVTGYDKQGDGTNSFYDDLPLAQAFMTLNLANSIHLNEYYRSTDKGWGWWNAFKDFHWSTGVIGWIVDGVLWLLLMFCIFSIPRLLAAPFMNLTIRLRFLPNSLVKVLNLSLFMFAGYCFVLFMAVSQVGFWLPLGVTLFVSAAWWGIHSSTINYERCPECHRFHVADDMGSSKGSKVREITNSTYDVYRGSTTSGNTKTLHYDRHKKKNVKVYQNYKDHRECHVCGATWNVGRRELEKEWNEYD